MADDSTQQPGQYPPAQQPPPGQYGGPPQGYPPPQGQSGMAVAALVLGILGVVLGWIPFVGLICGVLAAIFGALAWKKANQTNGRTGMAIAGTILGIIGILFGLAWLVFFNEVGDAIEEGDFDEELDQLEQELENEFNNSLDGSLRERGFELRL